MVSTPMSLINPPPTQLHTPPQPSTSLTPTQVMIRFKSFLLQILYTLFFALPLLFGLWEQKQIVELVLFENFYEPYGNGALSALVTVQHHGVQVYSTQLSIEANFSGFT